MKLNQILREAEQSQEQMLLNLIRVECSQYLSENTPYVNLYRGMRLTGAAPPYMVHHTVADRKPLDTRRVDHEVLDLWFKVNTGIAFRSNHVMFCTGHSSRSGYYGNRFAAFPCNGYKYCWSPVITDLTDSLRGRNWDETPDEHEERLTAILENGKYQMTDLPGAIKSGNEIMIHCDKYVLVDHELMDIAPLLT